MKKYRSLITWWKKSIDSLRRFQASMASLAASAGRGIGRALRYCGVKTRLGLQRSRQFLARQGGYLKTETLNTVKNREVIVPVLGLLLIPLLYSGVYLIANWDPYGRVSNLPVAVVNLDKPVKFQGKTIDIGNRLVDNLQHNDSVDFQFVSKEKAEQGLKNYDYYLLIEIPPDTSQAATTILDPKPQKMELVYKENSAYNFLSASISDKVVEKIQKEVSAEVTETFTEEMFEALTQVSDGLRDASDGAGKLESGLKQLGDGISEFKKQVNGKIDAAMGSADQRLDSVIDEYGDKLHERINEEIDKEIAANKDPIDTRLHEEVNKAIADNAGTVKQRMHNEIDAAVQNNAESVRSVLHEQIDKAFAEYGGDVRARMHKEIDSAVDEYSEQIRGKLHSEANGLIDEYSGKTRSRIHSEIDKAIDEYSDAVKTYIIASVDDEINQQIDQIVSDAKANAKQLDDTFARVLKELEPVIDQLPADKQEQFRARLAELEKAKQQIVDWMDSQLPGLKQKLNDRVNQIIGKRFDEKLPQITGKIHSVVDDKFDELLPQLEQKMNNLIDDKYAELLPQIVSRIHSAADTKLDELEPKVQSELHAKADEKFDELQPKLREKLHEAAEDKFNALLPEVTNRLHQVAEDKYQALLPELQQRLHEAADEKFDEAKGKVSELSHDKLDEVKGIATDAQGTLNDAFDQLLDGQQQLLDGEQLLKDELRKGAEKATLDPSDQTYNMFAQPVESSQVSNHDVEYYGEGMAPYFLALGLFVGALMFSLFYPLKKTTIAPPNGPVWFLGKFGFMLAESLLQTIILVAFVLYGLKLEVTSVPVFFTVALFSSITFYAIIQFLSSLFGNVGRFMIVIMLVLQLSASAGTFPIELTPEFFQQIHPYLPMTYSVRAFRAVISSGDYAFMWSSLDRLAWFLTASLTGSLLYFTLAHYLKTRKAAKAQRKTNAQLPLES